MLTIADVSKSYGTRELFRDVSLFVSRNDRYGLVGANGTGKTTLFRLILGEESPDEGSLSWERGADFGFLPQETAPAGDETVLQLALGHTPAHNLDPAHDHFYDEREPQAKKILAGLGFREADFDKPARTFSGGWVMRAHLARLLVAEPALLLLDEPTNHLDLHALLWFQDYLSRYPGGLLLISHDRAFLNSLCTGILEMRALTLNRYTGNYDDYLRQKDERHAQQAAIFKNQQREIAHLQKFVDRFGAKASMASRAKSKEKQIERLQDVAVEAPEEDLKRINFRFPQPARSGLRVVTLEHVQQAYGDHVVYRDLNFTAERGQRIVLVGPNGSGKSTLLKILADAVPISGGKRELGGNVTPGYFAQNRTDVLRTNASVLDNVMELRTAENDLTEQRARTILGAFLFRKDDVYKKVAVLSGGEKSRLALAKLLVNPPNLLLMDEPTTHLDIPSIDALILALQQYSGTIIFISHDVYFIRQVALQVLHIDAGRLTPYAGNYDYYVEKSRATDARYATVAAGFTDARPVQAKTPAAGQAPRSGPKTKEQKRAEAEARAARTAPLRAAKARVQKLEAEISTLEKSQAEITTALEAPDTYNEAGKAQQLNRELGKTVARLEAATREWEKAASDVAELEKP
jgi:ATP-binding cassette subfamily F protein 3